LVTIEMGVFVVPLASSVRWESPSDGVAAAVPDKMNAVPIAPAAIDTMRVLFTIP
jgi:hypothetical protein